MWGYEGLPEELDEIDRELEEIRQELDDLELRVQICMKHRAEVIDAINRRRKGKLFRHLKVVS